MRAGGHLLPMTPREERCARLTNPGIIAVVRARRADQVLPLTDALLAGGVIAVEITTTTPHAIEAIRTARRQFGDRALLGVGTVLDLTTARAALEAGAEFVVSPILRRELVTLCHTAGVPVMLGAYTPTECQLAYEAGADYVKLFPADTLGPAYVKALRAPLRHLKLVPTGGVELANAAEFLRAGCVALGCGSSLVPADILERDDWPELTRRAAAFVAAVKER